MDNCYITFKFTWRRFKTDLSKCNCCKEKIFSDIFRLYIESRSNNKPVYTKTDIVLCESCFNIFPKS